jgi:hypothetical protein
MQTAEQIIAELAKEMNVSQADVRMLANSIVNSLRADKCVQAFIESDEQQKIELTAAYATHAVKKFESFHTTYISNPEARRVFQQSVFNHLS